MNIPSVSIIMPTYNSKETLPRAINSILNQKFQNFELIIIDDCSTDGSNVLLKNYVEKDVRIKLLKTVENSRSSKIQFEPRNNGLEIAKGEFIAYLDADNEWLPNFLEEMLNIFNSNKNIVFAYCNSLNFYPEGKTLDLIKNDPRKIIYLDEVSACLTHENHDPKEFGRSIYVDTNEIMHRFSIFEKVKPMWNTFHPRRDEIQKYQNYKRPSRRHNDMDLFERVFNLFGESSIFHLNKILIKYYLVV